MVRGGEQFEHHGGLTASRRQSSREAATLTTRLTPAAEWVDSAVIERAAAMGAQIIRLIEEDTNRPFDYPIEAAMRFPRGGGIPRKRRFRQSDAH